MDEKKKVRISKKAMKNIAGISSQIFAMAMAFILLMLGMRYLVLHPYYGSYMISPYESSKDFQETQTFQMIFQRDLMSLSNYMALCSQLETAGEYDPDREIDIFEYAQRKEKNTSRNTDSPKLVYRIGDLIEWAQYGMEYYSEEGLEEEFTPQNMQSIYDLELPEGMTMDDVTEILMQAANDLNENYNEYCYKKEMFSADGNFKYMFLSADGQILYTNLENREKLSEEELKKAFKSCKTYVVYDYAQNEMQSNNLQEKHVNVNYYKSYFRDYSYCFPEGGTVYAAVQTKSSSAFGPFDGEDFYALVDADMGWPDASWEELVGLAVVMGVLSLITLILFIAWQPKKKKQELTYFDTWFTELAVFFAGATAAAVIAIGVGAATLFMDYVGVGEIPMEDSKLGCLLSFCLTFVVLYAMFLLYMGSLVRRIKAKTLWRGSFFYYLLHNAKKICQKSVVFIQKVLDSIMNHKVFVVRTFGPYCLFLLINVLLVLTFSAFGILLAIVFDVLVAFCLYYEDKAREEIIEGITRICDGDVEYQIDTAKFWGENKALAEAVNKIGEAVKTAVQISMKDERLKADLITNVSHDIKTPLTSIINYVDLLKRENIQGEKAQEYIRVLEEKSQRLKQLTLDLVEASKISSGNITLEVSDIDVNELIKQAVGEYRDKLEEKRLVLIESFSEQENMVILADSRRMWRVVENLLVNICKYSMEGTRVYVDINKVSRACKNENDMQTENELVEITFKNISAQPLNVPAEELTERFIRGDLSRSTEGSGLGLSIAQNLTIAQGGEFEIYLDGDLFKVVMRFPKK